MLCAKSLGRLGLSFREEIDIIFLVSRLGSVFSMASAWLAGVLLIALLWINLGEAQLQEFESIGLVDDELEAFLAPISPLVTNEKCREDSLLYLTHLRNFTLWAAKSKLCKTFQF